MTRSEFGTGNARRWPTNLDYLHRLPQTFCHQDAWKRNLFARRGQTVAIDWGYAGIAPLGAELAALIVASFELYKVPTSQAFELNHICFEGYLQGLRDAGWDGSRLVRFGYALLAQDHPAPQAGMRCDGVSQKEAKMITTTDLVGALERNLDIIKSQTQGLTHAESLLQLPFRGNCMNWVLGHIAANRSNMLQFLGEIPILSEAHLKRYGYGSEPVYGDAGDILTLEQLLTVLEQSQQALTARLQKTTTDELVREVQSFLGTTTLGQLVFFLYWHESYHTGQTEALRQLAGKDDKVI